MARSHKFWKGLNKEKQFKFEDLLIGQNIEVIAGVDECHIGCAAGPVVAAVVVLDLEATRNYSFKFEKKSLFPHDSKSFTMEEREALLEDMRNKGLLLRESVGWTSVEEINQVQDMNKARSLAWKRAAENIDFEFEAILCDFFKFPEASAKGIQVISAIKMDEKSVSVGAASLVAKTTSDKYMIKLDKQYGGKYRWSQNMGYATPDHLSAIKKHGVTKEHRYFFKNIKKIIEKYGESE